MIDFIDNDKTDFATDHVAIFVTCYVNYDVSMTS